MVSRSNRLWLIALLAGLVAAFAPLAAQAPAPVRLSFADAVRLASGEVPVVALATLRTTEADARVRQARAALLPSAAVGGFWLNRTFNSRSIGISFPGVPELIGPFNNYDARVGASQTLFDWSSVKHVRAAGAQADGSRAERGVTVEASVLTTAIAYVRAVRAQAVVGARQADSAIAAELVGLAEAQRAAGVSPAIDVTRARAQLARAQGLLLVAKNQLDRGRIDVTRALGLDAATPLAFSDSLAPSLGAADVSVQRDSAVSAALANRPELRAELARAAAARQTGSAIRAERLPRIELAGDYGVNGPTAPRSIATRDITVQVSVPILDGFRREARLDEQDAVVRESQVREADLRRQIAGCRVARPRLRRGATAGGPRGAAARRERAQPGAGAFQGGGCGQHRRDHRAGGPGSGPRYGDRRPFRRRDRPGFAGARRRRGQDPSLTAYTDE